MWIFSVTPDWLYHTLFFTSLTAVLAGFFLAKVPLVKQYSILLKWGGLSVVVLSLFLEGALYDYNVMQSRIEEVKQQVAEYEKANQEANDKLAQLQADFKNKSKVKREYITRYIDREIVRYDEKFKPGGICEIPKEFIKAHNDATERAK
jgi:hypothetical protein